MAKKTKFIGDYQYDKVTLKEANYLRAFGWLTNFKSEHEGKKGEKLYSIRRDKDIALDPVIKINEKTYKKYYSSYEAAVSPVKTAEKKYKNAHRWSTLFAILGIVGAVFILGYFLLIKNDAFSGAASFKAVTDWFKMNLNTTKIMDKVTEVFNDGLFKMGDGDGISIEIRDFVIYAAAAGIVGIISMICAIAQACKLKACRNGKMDKLPKTSKAQTAGNAKVIKAFQNAQKAGSERLYQLKCEKPYLMTKNDRKMTDLGNTMSRVLNRNNGNVDEYD